MHRKKKHLQWPHHDVWGHLIQDSIYQYNRPLTHKVHVLISTVLQAKKRS